jgi:hypothetical protein
MILCIIVGWFHQAHEGTAKPEENSMLFVELNVAGYRFSREIRGLRRKSFRSPGLGPRAMHWRIPHLRNPHAA